MRKLVLVAGMAVAALIPSMAMAQQSCEQQRDNRVVGTLAGAGVGALIGSSVAGHNNRTAGAIIGGIGGAVVGNQLTKPGADCAHAYGYYDRNGYWHVNNVRREDAAGYFDREGHWVDGAPTGYYDRDGRWVRTGGGDTAGYVDGRGRWIPASATGYYDTDGQWIAGSASGYYDQNGRWIKGPATGRYDVDGRWMPGAASGHRDANGVWVADAQPGYYDENGRWRAGEAMGFYDAEGHWIATEPATRAPQPVYATRPDRDHAYGYYDPNGGWHANAVHGQAADAAGYYDRNGRWVEGAPNGVYDSSGRWIPADGGRGNGHFDERGQWAPASATGYYGSDGRWIPQATYVQPRAPDYQGRNPDQRPDAGPDLRTREAWLDNRIHTGMQDGTLSRRAARNAIRTLSAIRGKEASMRRYNGQLSDRQTAYISARLDALRASLR